MRWRSPSRSTARTPARGVPGHLREDRVEAADDLHLRAREALLEEALEDPRERLLAGRLGGRRERDKLALGPVADRGVEGCSDWPIHPSSRSRSSTVVT